MLDTRIPRVIQSCTEWSVSEVFYKKPPKFPVLLTDVRDGWTKMHDRKLYTAKAEVIHTVNVKQLVIADVPMWYKENTIVSNIVLHSGDDRHCDVALWHEVGHIMHRQGNSNKVSQLAHELAADAWALQNYNGPESLDFVITLLGGWLDSYVNTEVFRIMPVPRTPDLYNTAKILMVDHQINWR